MGLSKPVITTSTDISGITSVLSEIKADAAAAKNNAATAASNAETAAKNSANSGAVKSVQRGTVPYGTAGINASPDSNILKIYGGDKVTYIDVTISSVNTSKAAVILDSYSSSNFVPVLISSTKLRIHISTGYDSTVLGGIAWQVVEYK